MTHRATLIAMGFEPHRVDWAIRETLSTNDIQSAVDHIVEHESDPIPGNTHAAPAVSVDIPPPLPTRPLWSPPIAHPTPSRVPNGSDVAAQEALIRSMESLAIEPEAPDGPPLEPPYAASLTRFRNFLQIEQSIMYGVLETDKEKRERAYRALEDFFRQELARRREQYGLPLRRQPVHITPTATCSPPHIPATQETLSPIGQQLRLQPEADSTVTIVPATFGHAEDSTGPHCHLRDSPSSIIPVSEDLSATLKAICVSLSPGSQVQAALERAQALRPEFGECIWNIRQEYSSRLSATAEIQALDEAERQKLHSKEMRILYETSQYDTAVARDEAFQASEKKLRHSQKEKEYQDWKTQVAEIGTSGCMEALQKLQVEYAFVEEVVEDTPEGIDFLHAARCLEEISGLMENDGVATLEALEDEISQKTHDLQVHAIWNDPSRADGWGDSSKLDAAKATSDLELALIRAKYKIQRITPCLTLLLTRLKSELAKIEAEEVKLGTTLLHVVQSIPPILTLQEEETAQASCAAVGQTWIPPATPSDALVAQIRQAHSVLCDLSARAGEFLLSIQQISERHRAIAHAARVKEVLVTEHHAGSGDASWFSERMKVANQDGEQEAMAIINEYNQQEQKRTERFKPIGEPTLELLSKAKARELAIRTRQAASISEGATSLNSPGHPITAGEAMAKVYQQQQQSQMISNMMWSQHASRMAVINNIGSSSTQWVVSYR